MDDAQFRDGYLLWSSETISAVSLIKKHLGSPWEDGFAAFARMEQRLAADDMKMLPDWLEAKEAMAGKREGHLMEAGLWRTERAVYEELAIERAGDEFFVQYWHLSVSGQKEVNCYWRQAETFIRPNLEIFKKEAPISIEVIVPEHRLRLYLTKGKRYETR